MKQAETFGRPVICFVDTPGAFCGLEAEERGQGEAIVHHFLTTLGAGFAPDHIADRFPCVLQHFLRAGFCFLGGFFILVIVVLVGGETAWNDLRQVDFCLQQSVQAL